MRATLFSEHITVVSRQQSTGVLCLNYTCETFLDIACMSYCTSVPANYVRAGTPTIYSEYKESGKQHCVSISSRMFKFIFFQIQIYILHLKFLVFRHFVQRYLRKKNTRFVNHLDPVYGMHSMYIYNYFIKII